MSTKAYLPIYKHVVEQLLSGLSPQLTYHSINHTLDVLKQCERIAEAEGSFTEKEIFLLKVAALYHDTGFLHKYAGHEEAGCELARECLPGFGLTTEDIDSIVAMIRATRIPQTPTNKLGEVICDADLDYLGRPDFFEGGDRLLHELKSLGKIANEKEWDPIQISFLKAHKYFTATNNETRKPQKLAHLQMLEDRVRLREER